MSFVPLRFKSIVMFVTEKYPVYFDKLLRKKSIDSFLFSQKSTANFNPRNPKAVLFTPRRSASLVYKAVAYRFHAYISFGISDGKDEVLRREFKLAHKDVGKGAAGKLVVRSNDGALSVFDGDVVSKMSILL